MGILLLGQVFDTQNKTNLPLPKVWRAVNSPNLEMPEVRTALFFASRESAGVKKAVQRYRLKFRTH